MTQEAMMGPEGGLLSGSGAVVAFLWMIAIVIPFGRIFSRAGLSWAWSLLCFVPVFGWFAAWLILARRDWPGRSI